jgi:ribonuclease HI
MTEHLERVRIYCDGACEPNPGPGGYGVVVMSGNTRSEYSGGFSRTTNNRAELYAAIRALEVLTKPSKVTLHSDSQYVVNAMINGSAQKWKQQGWLRSKINQVPNSDLWEKLLGSCQVHQVQFDWVRGHSGNKENERCDELSYAALGLKNLEIDEGYIPKANPVPNAEGERPKASYTKITEVGQPCRKCETPVIKQIPHQKRKPDQTYYFEYYLFCPHCQTRYMVDEAKRVFGDEPHGG